MRLRERDDKLKEVRENIGLRTITEFLMLYLNIKFAHRRKEISKKKKKQKIKPNES